MGVAGGIVYPDKSAPPGPFHYDAARVERVHDLDQADRMPTQPEPAARPPGFAGDLRDDTQAINMN
jgi:hypothetical protein